MACLGPYPSCPVPDSINAEHSGGGGLGELYYQHRLAPLSAKLVELGLDPALISEGYACSACYNVLGLQSSEVLISWPD